MTSDEFYKKCLKLKLTTGVEIEFKVNNVGDIVVTNVIGNGIDKIYLPEGISIIESHSLSALKCETLVLPRGNILLDSYCCGGNMRIKNIIADSVDIGESAFSQCFNLKSFKANKICSLGNFAFEFCTNLSEFSFDNVISNIFGGSCFSDCAFESINLKNLDWIYLGRFCFRRNLGLKDVKLPKTLFESYCFGECENLEKFEINGVLGSDFIGNLGTSSRNILDKCNSSTKVLINNIDDSLGLTGVMRMKTEEYALRRFLGKPADNDKFINVTLK